MARKHPIIPSGKLDKLDRYIAFVTGEDEILTEAEKQEFWVLSLVDDQLRRSLSWQKINMVVRTKTGIEWSKATTFRYITYAKYVFGSSRHIDKNFERQRVLDWFEKAIFMAIQKKDYWFLGKQLNAYAKIAQLNVPNEAETEKYTPHQYILNIINNNGKNTQVNLADTLGTWSEEERRELAAKVQRASLPDDLDQAMKLIPPLAPDTLDEQ